MIKLFIIGAVILAVVTGAAGTIYHIVHDDAQRTACNRAEVYHRDHPDFTGKIADDLVCQK